MKTKMTHTFKKLPDYSLAESCKAYSQRGIYDNTWRVEVDGFVVGYVVRDAYYSRYHALDCGLNPVGDYRMRQQAAAALEA